MSLQRKGRSMPRYGNHINAIALIASLLSGCAKRADESPVSHGEKVVFVSSESYQEDVCWKHKDESFRAFLVLGKDNSYAVPHFLSVNCMIKGNFSSYAEATILHVGTIRMLDSHRLIQGRFPSLRIGGNVATDQPFPSADSELYYFRADLEKVAHPYQKVYTPSKIKKMVGVGTSFDRFLRLSPSERETLLNSIKD